mmetsp:Transcript_23493/g.44270  ORF Transcript_23493/g.44270 Transcript_23493/m.44270 type:complete len:277 (+) Transcript_23493:51-881(+)
MRDLRNSKPGHQLLARRQAKACLIFLAAAAGAAFVPARINGPRLIHQGQSAQGSSPAEDDQYDWQRVSGRSADEGMTSLADLPDLPDFSEEDAGTGEGEVTAQVKVREVSLPDLPGIDDDLLPPGPNPWSDGGLGFLEWTGIWAALLAGVLAVGAGGSFLLARLQVEPQVASQLLDVLKPLLNLYQLLFLARVLLAQFPKLDTKEWPWAIFHYPTEFVLGPTRMILKPEAGVDVSPFVWLLFTSLLAELLTGSFGILQMVKDSSRSRLGDSIMSIR